MLPDRRTLKNRRPFACNSKSLNPWILKQSDTVGEIVDAMRYCAFGARMLGEVARTMRQMIAAPKKPIIIYDGALSSPLGRLAAKVRREKMVREDSPAV